MRTTWQILLVAFVIIQNVLAGIGRWPDSEESPSGEHVDQEHSSLSICSNAREESQVVLESLGTPACNSSWTKILNRFNGQINFYRDWQDYKNGFGCSHGEFFIGLDKLHTITASKAQELLIALEDFNGTTKYALYDEFLVGNESDSFALKKLGNYTGNAGDSLAYHLNMKFSTYDRDNDGYSGNCAVERMGAWWYNWCNNSHLFGMYLRGNYTQEVGVRGITWWEWRGPYYSYRKVQIFVRPKF